MSEHRQQPLIPRPELTFNDVCPPGREDVPVGCVCNGGVIYLNGVMPAACPHCGGKGTVSRERYRELFGDTGTERGAA